MGHARPTARLGMASRGSGLADRDPRQLGGWVSSDWIQWRLILRHLDLVACGLGLCYLVF
jgi:hypothetical protein